MALSQSAVSDLLDALRVGEGTDLVRELAEWALQQLIEAEATEKIGAGPYERTDQRSNERNGHRPRIVSTKAGDLEVAIPKLRKGSFFPEVLERRRRVDQALYAVIMEAYVNGVSTRSVDNLVAAMGVEAGSPSRRCRGSVSGSTNALQRSGVAPSVTSGSRTSISTRPMSMFVTTPWARSCRVLW